MAVLRVRKSEVRPGAGLDVAAAERIGPEVPSRSADKAAVLRKKDRSAEKGRACAPAPAPAPAPGMGMGEVGKAYIHSTVPFVLTAFALRNCRYTISVKPLSLSSTSSSSPSL